MSMPACGTTDTPLPELVIVGESQVPGWVLTIGVHLLLGGLFFIIATIRIRWIRRRADQTRISDAGGIRGGDLSPS